MSVMLRDVAASAFERIVRSFPDPHTLLNLTLDFCVEIQKEMTSMKVQLEPDDVKKFVKSAAVQLYRLKKKFDENPTMADGHWIGKKDHMNQILTTFEEALLCGILTSQRHLGVKLKRETSQ